MTRVASIFRRRFGRIALLDLDTSLVGHAPIRIVTLIFKVADQEFVIGSKPVPLRRDTVVAGSATPIFTVRPWATLPLAFYIELDWLAEADRIFPK